MYQVFTIGHSTLWTIYYYVSEHQFSSVINPILRLQHMSIEVLCYWNWLVGDIVCILSGFHVYLGLRSRLLALNQALPQGNQVTCITSQVTCITCITGTRTGTGWDISHPTGTRQWNPFRLRNLYPRSTQNTDVVSSINFFNPSVNCLIIMLLYYQEYLMHILPRLLG